MLKQDGYWGEHQLNQQLTEEVMRVEIIARFKNEHININISDRKSRRGVFGYRNYNSAKEWWVEHEAEVLSLYDENHGDVMGLGAYIVKTSVFTYIVQPCRTAEAELEIFDGSYKIVGGYKWYR